MEIIKAIEVVDNYKPSGDSSWTAFEGYRITTSKQVILVLIDNGSSCCENFGYIASEDDLERFVGANLREVSLTDKALNTKVLGELPSHGNDGEDEAIFVNFDTSRGLFQLAVYNYHNGYYGHSVIVTSNSFSETGYL